MGTKLAGNRGMKNGLEISRAGIAVCAWCHPHGRVYASFPWLARTTRLTHGICESHRSELTAQINAMQQKPPGRKEPAEAPH